ncbi:hypothetical protein PGQ11_001648 [Apiospora arundinis]|uniref:DUF7730 domain-containing protein n=1 Tax=Apiospora arundinis TaxID=335852 RepID=A0ABR2JFJ6_9PEZI
MSPSAASSPAQQPLPQPQQQQQQQPQNQNQIQFPDHTDLDLGRMLSSAHPQSNSALMRLPLEIRDMIFAELWGSSPDVLHIMYRGGRFVRMGCICDPVADRDHLNKGADYYRQPFTQTGPALATNTCCCCHNHRWEGLSWPRDPCPSWFAVLLSCKRLYLERRTDIHKFVRFAVHDDVTLKHLVVPNLSRPGIPSLLRHATTVHLTMRFRLHYGDRPVSSWATWRIAELNQTWQQCCAGLERLVAENDIILPKNSGAGGGSLTSINLWMDTVDSGGRTLFWDMEHEGDTVESFPFGPAMVSILSLDLPVKRTRPGIQRDFRVNIPTWTLLHMVMTMIEEGIAVERIREVLPQGLIQRLCYLEDAPFAG